MNNRDSALFWPPLNTALRDRALLGDAIVLILSPFIKSDALDRFLTDIKCKELKIVCRWRPEDLIAGVSDIDIYNITKRHSASLYINPSIHLKLYVFSSNIAFNTSGNLTFNGLGYENEVGNIEAGSFVTLSQYDWAQIFRVIEQSQAVDENLYKYYEDIIRMNPPIDSRIQYPPFAPFKKKFSISSLPATENPRKLFSIYVSSFSGDNEDVRRAVHDCVLLNVPNGLSEDQFHKHLASEFKGSAFVREFVEVLREQRDMRFGAVNDWIHSKCDDVPLPYRWEIKDNTRIFYEWLSFYFSEITWDRPNFSQVIYWRGE